MQVPPVAASSHVYEVRQEGVTFDQLMAQAKATRSLPEKRVHYQSAFDLLQGQKGPQVYQVLHAYAQETCYAQESPERDKDGNSLDPEMGYRKCARLMEVSLLAQTGITMFDGGDIERLALS